MSGLARYFGADAICKWVSEVLWVQTRVVSGLASNFGADASREWVS